LRIHKEGKGILLWSLLGLLLFHFFLIKHTNVSSFGYVFFSISSSLIYLWIVWFFRDPCVSPIIYEQGVISPADGKVIFVHEVYEDEFFKDKRIKISIFMSPFNVHINRSPVSGVIEYFKYYPGKHLVAWHPKSSKDNERTTVVVFGDNSKERILFRQIAGFMARRIKFYHKKGDRLNQGEECGFIKFGSRADVFLPINARVLVKPGDKVQGGTSVLADL